jgi:transcriptional regulator NrdR family protein
MKLIKKNGSVQEFEVVKLEQSILRSSDDLEQPLNTGDVKYIIGRIESVLKSIRGEGNTSAYEVFAVAIHVLNEEGFQAIAYNYFKGREGKQ